MRTCSVCWFLPLIASPSCFLATSSSSCRALCFACVSLKASCFFSWREWLDSASFLRVASARWSFLACKASASACRFASALRNVETISPTAAGKASA